MYDPEEKKLRVHMISGGNEDEICRYVQKRIKTECEKAKVLLSVASKVYFGKTCTLAFAV